MSLSSAVTSSQPSRSASATKMQSVIAIRVAEEMSTARVMSGM